MMDIRRLPRKEVVDVVDVAGDGAGARDAGATAARKVRR